MPMIWFNHGYASTRDAIMMIRADAGGQLAILASHRDADAPMLAAADVALIEPRFADDADGRAQYLAWCLDMCAAHDVTLLIPGFGKRILASHAAAFAAIGTRLSVPADADTLALLHDKTAFTLAAAAAGLPTPWTREIRDGVGFDAALADLADLGLPACVKPPEAVFGAGFWRLDPVVSAFAGLMDPDARILPPLVIRAALDQATEPAALLVMEYLPGDEWSIDAVCDHGRMIVAVARRKIGRAQWIEVDGPVFAIARAAIARFGLSGLVNLQCKAAGLGGGDPRLLEINARMSGGCLYTQASGVNLPWWHVALALGIADEADIPAPVGGACVVPVAGSVRIDAGVPATAAATSPILLAQLVG